MSVTNTSPGWTFDISDKSLINRASPLPIFCPIARPAATTSDVFSNTNETPGHYDPQTKTRFTLWCAENMGFLPIRIRKINYKGKVVLLNLTHFNQQAIDLILDEDEDEDTD